MTENEQIKLIDLVKRDIYLDFRELQGRFDLCDQIPIPPNKKSFLSAYLQFYLNIRMKIIKSIEINGDKFKEFEPILKYMENKYSITELNLNICKTHLFLMGAFLDKIGITQIWD